MSYGGAIGGQFVSEKDGRKYIYKRVLINNGDVTRRFLSLRAGPICTAAAAAYELMNHRRPAERFFFLIDGNRRIFFSLFSLLSNVVSRFTSENTHLSRLHNTHIHTPSHTYLRTVRISSPSPVKAVGIYTEAPAPSAIATFTVRVSMIYALPKTRRLPSWISGFGKLSGRRP